MLVTDAGKSFMDGLDATVKKVEASWTLPGAIKSRSREMFAFIDDGGQFPRDPLDGLDRELTAQEALKVLAASHQVPLCFDDRFHLPHTCS
jgi:hypothetical protein